MFHMAARPIRAIVRVRSAVALPRTKVIRLPLFSWRGRGLAKGKRYKSYWIVALHWEGIVESGGFSCTAVKGQCMTVIGSFHSVLNTKARKAFMSLTSLDLSLGHR